MLQSSEHLFLTSTTEKLFTGDAFIDIGTIKDGKSTENNICNIFLMFDKFTYGQSNLLIN